MRSNEGRDMFLKYYNSSLDFKSKNFKKLCSIAKKLKIILSIGVMKKIAEHFTVPNFKYFKNGEILGKHRKVMPTAMERLFGVLAMDQHRCITK